MYKHYIDTSFFTNPIGEYGRWFLKKVSYQLKYWGNHLRIGYRATISNSTFATYNWIGRYTVIANCKLDDYTYCGDYCTLNNADIGKFCSIGPNVKIAPGKHPTSLFISTHPVTFNNQPNFVKSFVGHDTFKNYEKVHIGNDVWIGANSIIIDGVTIADGAVIAANSVVNKNVNAYEIVGGVPAKFIKMRFNENEIKYLLKIKWWHKGEEWIKTNIDKFHSPNDFFNIKTDIDDK